MRLNTLVREGSLLIMRFVAVVVGLSVGVGTAGLLLWQLKNSTLPPLHPLNVAFGIHKHEVIGFLPYWLITDVKQDYQPYLTTLTYFGLVINPDGSIQEKVNRAELEPGFAMLKSEKLTAKLKEARTNQINLSLLVHLSDEADIRTLLTQPEQHAKRLVDDVVPLMQLYGFTDLNIDIESFREASKSAQVQFGQFLTTIKQELDTRQIGTLTVEISPSALFRSYLIDPQLVGTVADKVVLMAYDYHYSGSFVTGPVAPLGGAGEIREIDVLMGIREAQKVIDAKKLILGIPLYGYEWETIAATASAAVIPGSGRTISHDRAATLLTTCASCSAGIDPTSQESYTVFPDPVDPSHHVFYMENPTVISQKLAEVKWWRGAAVWALGYEGEGIIEPLKHYKSQALFLWRD